MTEELKCPECGREPEMVTEKDDQDEFWSAEVICFCGTASGVVAWHDHLKGAERMARAAWAAIEGGEKP